MNINFIFIDKSISNILEDELDSRQGGIRVRPASPITDAKNKFTYKTSAIEKSATKSMMSGSVQNKINIKGSNTQRTMIKEELKSDYQTPNTNNNFSSTLIYNFYIFVDDLASKIMSPMDQPQNLLVSDKTINSRQSLKKLNIVNLTDTELDSNMKGTSFPKIRSTSQL